MRSSTVTSGNMSGGTRSTRTPEPRSNGAVAPGSSESRPAIRKRATAPAFLVVPLLLLPAVAAAQIEVIAVVAGTITFSAGSSDGVKAGSTGRVRATEIVAGKAAVHETASFKVTSVRERTSEAGLTKLAPGATIVCGMEIVFDLPLVKPAPAALPAELAPRGWLPQPGRDPLFYLSRDDEALQKGQPDGAEAFVQMEFGGFPEGTVARRNLDEIAARIRAADAEVSREREEAEIRAQVLARLPDADDDLKSGDALLDAGDKEGARAFWEKVAAVDLRYPGLRDRARKLVPAAGERRLFAPSGAEFKFLPPGAFQAGCVPQDGECAADEKPRHPVTIGSGFWMATNLATVAQYREFATSTGRAMPPAPAFPQAETHPVVNVTWDDAVSFCTWAGGRLPTEAEWEYAARGGRDGQTYPWGASISHGNANYSGTGERDLWEYSSPAGSFEANGFGLFDMAGNASEWCADRYDPGYWDRSPSTDPKGPAAGSQRALRGGSWLYSSGRLRISARDRLEPESHSEDVGFRCARDVPPWISVASASGPVAAR